MKRIKKIGKTVAGSALLVGATLAGAASMGAAQSSGSSGMTLGDYPQPFVNEDGEIDSTIVVGEDAATVDVVAGMNIAGSLGNAAFTQESIDVPGGASGTWSAENGVTLNRQNSNIFLNDATDAEVSRLDASDLNILEESEFESYDDNDVDVEYEVNVGNQNQGFDAVGDLDDPVVHVNVPTNPTSGDNLMEASVEFSDSIDFTAAGDDSLDSPVGEEAIEDGEEIEMFGTEYTFSEESDSSELVFFGSSDRVEVNTGESTTIEVDGQELRLESTYVSDSNPREATVIVGGTTETVEEGDTVGPGGEVRISDIYRTGPDGQGRVAFSQGSNELVIQDDGDIEVDGDEVDNVQAGFNGDNFDSLEQINFFFGAEDSDEGFVEAGEMYEDPLFGLEFHYGGLTGDTAENPEEAIQLNVAEDDTAEVTVNDRSGDSADVVFMDNSDNGANTNPTKLTSDNNEYYATVEGEAVTEDDRVVLNSNEEAGLYEVTDITNDVIDGTNYDGSANSNNDFTDEDFAVTLENVVTGDTVEIEETDVSETDSEFDASSDTVTLSSESVEGKDFDITFTQNGVQFTRTGEPSTQVFPTLYTSSDAGLIFTDEAQVDLGADASTGDAVLEMPSTGVSSDQDVTLSFSTVSQANDDALGVDVDGDSNNELVVDQGDTDSSTTTQTTVTAGQVDYLITASDSDTSAGSFTVDFTIEVEDNQGTPAQSALGPAVGVIQPEDDEDEEHAYFFEPDVSDGEGNLSVEYTGEDKGSVSSGNDLSEDIWVTADLDSQDNVEVGYNDYGSYTLYDTDDSDQETFNLHLPAGQSTAGMAVTGADGGLSSTGGGSAMASTPTYADRGYPSSAALDSEIGANDRDQNMILVGGPAVNSLVSELASENMTMTTDEYLQRGEGFSMVQLIEGAFQEDYSALVVAGTAGADTREAGNYIADYEDNQDELAGQTQVVVGEGSNSGSSSNSDNSGTSGNSTAQ